MRMFKQFSVRNCVSLDGRWEFYFPLTGTQIGVDGYQKGQKVELAVPQVWESVNQYVNYRGQAVARKIITVADDAPARLIFKGVSHTANVYLDGQHLAFHHNAFTPFSVDIPYLAAGEHELLVHISNEFGAISALHIPNDYYTYGGITRPCGIEFLQRSLFIRHVHVVTESNGGRWIAKGKAVVRNIGDNAVSAGFELSLAGVRYSKEPELYQSGDTELSFELAPQEVLAWSSRTPQLYHLVAELTDNGAVFDDWSERIGFRTVELAGEKILLNNREVFLIGFNRHEDHPEYGCAIPENIMRKDLSLMREMNCNAVRTSHYPNDERFLDLCDEMGFMVWEENHARGLQKKKMYHPKFREQCAACNEEMVREHFNHPSILMWGLLNECESGEDDGVACYKEQVEQLHALDQSRPVTFASCLHFNDRCQGMLDICSWNLYSRWYANNDITEDLDALIGRMEPIGMAGKPLIISEFGAGALPGYSDPVRQAKWSLERQAAILEESIRAYFKHSRISGTFIWQFCDVRVTEEEWAVTRPRSMNNKGVVDEYRRPKLSFEVVKRLFGERLATME